MPHLVENKLLQRRVQAHLSQSQRWASGTTCPAVVVGVVGAGVDFVGAGVDFVGVGFGFGFGFVRAADGLAEHNDH